MMLLRLMSGHSNVLRSTVPRYFTSTVSERTSASNKFEKKIPGIREHYEFISEWCHPNGSGHLFTYGEINKQNGSVRFFRSHRARKGDSGAHNGVLHADIVHGADHGCVRRDYSQG